MPKGDAWRRVAFGLIVSPRRGGRGCRDLSRVARSMTLQDAIDELYRIAVTEEAHQSPARLRALAQYCTEQLAARGVAARAGLQ
jgi:hypothetical protein